MNIQSGTDFSTYVPSNLGDMISLGPQKTDWDTLSTHATGRVQWEVFAFLLVENLSKTATWHKHMQYMKLYEYVTCLKWIPSKWVPHQ